MKTRISIATSVLLILCGLALVPVLYFPLWRIDLNAPQYPEGLKLLIYADKIGGNVDIINGLNHYIGMKTLHTKDFIEFTLLPYIISVFAVAFIVVGILRKRKWLNLLLILFALFGIIAMVDFWRWEYNYGHNLNPDAAIIVPGMAYQPPLIGYKQLLNFAAYSIPDTGGWIFIGAGGLLVSLVIFEWKRFKTLRKLSNIAIPFLFLSLMNSCNNSPEPLQLGKDHCTHCMMALSDNRFGAELITKKGRALKFDDTACLLSYLKENKEEDISKCSFYLTDFCSPHSLLNANNAHLLRGDHFKGPMNGNIAAFGNEDSMKRYLALPGANKIAWTDLVK